MRLFFNIFLFFSISTFFENTSYSLTDNQIKRICQKKYKKSVCIKNLKDKKLNLLQGNKIEIPVIPYK